MKRKLRNFLISAGLDTQILLCQLCLTFERTMQLGKNRQYLRLKKIKVSYAVEVPKKLQPTVGLCAGWEIEFRLPGTAAD